MRGRRFQQAVIFLAGVLFAAGAARPQAQADVEIDFIAVSAAHEYAARLYRAIWDVDGERIVSALETRTCLPFAEAEVAAVVADAVSHSGGPAHPMRLRASYAHHVKKSTLVHELGHRHLWQLAERPEDIDGHKALYLVLDRVWADVWGEDFAEDRVRGESDWRAGYDYGAAWSWAHSLTEQERARLWKRLLEMNGFADACDGRVAGAEVRRAGRSAPPGAAREASAGR